MEARDAKFKRTIDKFPSQLEKLMGEAQREVIDGVQKFLEGNDEDIKTGKFQKFNSPQVFMPYLCIPVINHVTNIF